MMRFCFWDDTWNSLKYKTLAKLKAQRVVPISCIAPHNPTKPPAGPWGDADLEPWFTARPGGAGRGMARRGWARQGMVHGGAGRGEARFMEPLLTEGLGTNYYTKHDDTLDTRHSERTY